MYLLNTTHISQKDVQNVFYHFCDKCFINKNLAELPNMFSCDVTFIMQDHIIKGINNVINELTFFLKHLDNEYSLDEINVNQLSANSCSISSIIQVKRMRLYCTTIMMLENNWKISQMHISTTLNQQEMVNHYDIEDLINNRTSELTKKLERLEVAASSDYLTGLYNRYKFSKILVNEFEYSVINEIPLSVIFIDIDNFKQINDRYGHLVGDQFILATANIIKEKLTNDLVGARWGGDEFVIMAPTYTMNEAITLANQIRTELEHYENYCHITITASFGVAQYDKGDTTDIFLNKADLALYKAKRKGKNRVES